MVERIPVTKVEKELTFPHLYPIRRFRGAPGRFEETSVPGVRLDPPLAGNGCGPTTKHVF